MSMIAWSDDYSVGIQEIDEQHKVLVGIINELYDALATKQHRDKVAHVLDELVEYTIVHFAVEETLMRIFHYEGYESHKAIHDSITGKVKAFQAQFNNGEAHVDMDLLIFLKDWLTEHIQKVDQQYTEHFLKHGVKKSWLRKFW